MYRTIIVGLDGSAPSLDALQLAQQLRAPEGRLVLTSIVPVAEPQAWLAGTDAYISDLCRRATAMLEHAAQQLPDDVPRKIDATIDPKAARALVELAEVEDADLIVLGPTHHHRAGIVAGRTTVQRLLHHAPCAVAVAAPGQQQRFGANARICVAYDATPEARLALEAAYGLAAATHARVDVCRVVELPLTPYAHVDAAAMRARDHEAAQGEVDDAVAKAPDGVVAEGQVVTGATIDRLTTLAVEADLLVAGSRRHGPIARVLARQRVLRPAHQRAGAGHCHAAPAGPRTSPRRPPRPRATDVRATPPGRHRRRRRRRHRGGPGTEGAGRRLRGDHPALLRSVLHLPAARRSLCPSGAPRPCASSLRRSRPTSASSSSPAA